VEFIRPVTRHAPCSAILALLISAWLAPAQTYTVSTFAGGALPVNIPGVSASLYGPQSAMAVDGSGNLFFADGNSVLRLDASTGVLTLVAGNGTAGYSGDDGPAISAQVRDPYGLAVDFAGNLYIGSFPTMWCAGSQAASLRRSTSNAQLASPYGLAVDSSGNLYIADSGNHRVRKVSGG